MRAAPTNAAIPVPPHPASSAPRVWKIQLPTTLPLRPKMMSQSSPYPPSFMAIPASQPLISPTRIDAPNISKCMTRSRLTSCLYHYINYISSKNYITPDSRGWASGQESAGPAGGGDVHGQDESSPHSHAGRPGPGSGLGGEDDDHAQAPGEPPDRSSGPYRSGVEAR